MGAGRSGVAAVLAGGGGMRPHTQYRIATFGTSLPQKHHENQYKSVHWANSTP